MKMVTALSRTLGKGTIFSFSIGKTSTGKIGFIPCATITSKANRDPSYRRPPPFPYKEKNYSMVRSWFDRTTLRFDENSKIIVVDGPIAVGKNAFAKQLAEDLDMLYMPGANLDSVYINSYGFDKRSLNDKLPPNLFQVDEKSFARDPFHISVPFLQFAMCELRLSEYIDALAHLMNTGQGVVMVRSWYSDMVFAEAMAKEKYIRKQVLNGYYKVRQELFPELLRPHLQIYLDIPVPVVQERIKKRGHDWEVNGKAITTSFLDGIEDAYKRKYLPEIESHSELLIYDWTEGGDLELVVEDIERLDFDKYTVYDSKMADWRFPKEQAVSDLRMTYTNTSLKTLLMLSYITYPILDCPELYISGDEQEIYEYEILNCPGSKYVKGYNADMGDTGILFKTKMDKPRYPHLEA